MFKPRRFVSRVNARIAPMRDESRKRPLALAASVFIASCEGTVTTDLTTEVPADPNIRQIVTPLLGIEFQRTDGSSASLTLNEAEAIDLMDIAGLEPVRLFTDEELPAGDYSGVRLVFDETEINTAYVINGIGSARALSIAQGPYAAVSFSVEEEARVNESLVLTLDLRLSLSTEGNEYRLAPVLRAMRSDEAGTIEGTVSVACLTNNTARSPAIYLYGGEDATADDFGGAGAQPIASAPITPVGDQFRYQLRFVPEGRYTLAVTCRGDLENPTRNDDMEFRGIRNVELDQGQTLQQNLTG